MKPSPAQGPRGSPLGRLRGLTQYLKEASQDLPDISFYGFRVGTEILILLSLLIGFSDRLLHLTTNTFV
jgi:hypothetical protein